MIISNEWNPYNECYEPDYRLSVNITAKQYNLTYEQVFAVHNNRAILNWGIFVEPKNPIILLLLHNIIDIIHKEYIHKSVIKTDMHEKKYKMILCATSPGIFTATIRNYILENPTNHGIRFSGIDFKPYQGRYTTGRKVDWKTGKVYPHFVYESNQSIALLSSYAPN